MKNILLFLSIAMACGLLLTNVYTSLIDAKSWGSNIPSSIGTARDYYKTVNPGNFFRQFSPINQVLALLALILLWKTMPSVRGLLGGALALYILADVMTFAYFYPRNAILFQTAKLTDVELLKKAWAEWDMMNWVRSAVLAGGIILSFLAVHRLYSLKY